MPLEKMILVEYADMKEEIKDLRKRIQKLESEIGRLEKQHRNRFCKLWKER